MLGGGSSSSSSSGALDRGPSASSSSSSGALDRGPSASDAAIEQTKSNIAEVIPDLVWVEYIVLFLELHEVGRLACTCKTLNSLLRDEPFVWQRLAQVQNEATLSRGYQTYLNPLRSNEIQDWREVVLLSNAKLLTGGGGPSSSIHGAAEEQQGQAAERDGVHGSSSANVAVAPHIPRLQVEHMSAERPPQQLETVPSSSSSTGVGVDRAQPLASDDADGGDSMHTARSDQNFSSAASASSSSLSSSKVNGLPPTKRPRTTINKIRIREEALQATGLDDLSGAARNFYGGHSGHLHWLEGTRVLAFAGNYYPDRVGGATPKSLPFIYEIDVSTSPARIVETINYARREVGENGNEDAPGPGQEQGRGRSAQSGGPRPGGSASSPRPGSQGWPHGEPHPQIMGAASAVWRRRVVFFGGGSPIDVNKINNDVTSFSIETKQWESFFRASVHAASNRHCIPGESFPRPRQGQRATVFQDRLFVFGGRESTIGRRRRAQREDGQEEEEDDGCRNDLWSFDLVQAQEYGETSTRRTTGTGSCSSTTGTTSASSMHASSSSASASLWKREEASGQVPPSRVWHASCDSTNGRWLVCAGSRWNFDKPEDERETHQFRQLFCLHLAERRWEEIRTQSIPPWVTAGCLVATGREILLFGGCKPQEVGPGGIRWQALTDESEETGWRSWYSHVGRDAFVFDAHERNWSPCVCEVSCDTQALWRSHFSAVFVPPTNQIFLFGGSRYFCGEYFHDLLVLDLPSAAGRHLPDRNASGVLFPGYVWNRWKGVLGRLRGLHATGDLDDDRMREVFQHLRQINREEDEESQEDEGAQEDVGPPERAPEADDNVNDVMEDAEDGVDEDESSDDGGDQAP